MVPGSPSLLATGDLDLRSSTIQTRQGGNIGIFTPSGQALLGNASAKPIEGTYIKLGGNNTTGIITMRMGDVDIFTDAARRHDDLEQQWRHRRRQGRQDQD